MSLEILDQPKDYPVSRQLTQALLRQDAAMQANSDAINNYVQTAEATIAEQKRQLTNYKVGAIALTITVVVLSYALCKQFIV